MSDAPMIRQAHPLSAAFPSMSMQEFAAYRDGVKPAPAHVIKALVATDWFQGLKKGQRAMYVSRWYHWLAVGSNQYVRRTHTGSPRYGAESSGQPV